MTKGPSGFAERLRFYFITDEQAALPLYKQAEIAVQAGATLVQYRKKSLDITDIAEVEAMRGLCRRHGVPFVINDNVLLAKAVDADGVHLGQDDVLPAAARAVLGADAIIGVSVSTLAELSVTDLSPCTYIGTGPVYETGTKADAKAVIGLDGLQAVVEKTALPVVAIGGVNARNVADCMAHGAAGGAVISCITRAGDPGKAAREMAEASGARPRTLLLPWQDEFALIDSFLSYCKSDASVLRVPPGDDAALLQALANPVVTTDAQHESVHFRLDWQSMAEIGRKAVEITFSDLAAAYARLTVLFVNLGVPDHMAEASVRELFRGIQARLEAHKAALGGGNVSSAPRLSLDLFAIGEGRAGIFPLRSNARPGDGVYVTGALGLARAELICLQSGQTGFPALVDHFKNPRARFEAARILADAGVSCVMDISDGLAGDAAHIARASNLTILFEPESLQVDPALEHFCAASGLSIHEMLFAGGEDYELLFTCPEEIFNEVRQHLPEAFLVGRCLPPQAAWLENLPPGAASYQHGRR